MPNAHEWWHFLIEIPSGATAACLGTRFRQDAPCTTELSKIGDTGVVVDHESPEADEREGSSPATREREHGFGELRHYVPQDVLDVSFPVAVRGYDRRAVDAYVKRVNRVIAELKVSSSPPAAVRHALEQAEEKVQDLLRAAREAADEITASAQQEADERTGRAKAEAAELIVNTSAEADRVKAEADDLVAKASREADDTVAKAKAETDEMLAAARAEAQNTLASAQTEAKERIQRLEEELDGLRERAEARLHQLQADTETVWKERHELLDDIHRIASNLVEVANTAASRFPRKDAPEPKGAGAKAGAGPPRMLGDESIPPVQEVGSDGPSGNDSREDVSERTASGPDT
jgi:DivIVA domain-containing protein